MSHLPESKTQENKFSNKQMAFYYFKYYFTKSWKSKIFLSVLNHSSDIYNVHVFICIFFFIYLKMYYSFMEMTNGILEE